MFGLFKRPEAFIDPELCEFRQSGGAWRGTLALQAGSTVRPVVTGSGTARPASGHMSRQRSFSWPRSMAC